MKLTKTQKNILDKMEFGKTYSSYDLQVRISSLESMNQKGYVKRHSGLGSIFSPTTSIKFERIK